MNAKTEQRVSDKDEGVSPSAPGGSARLFESVSGMLTKQQELPNSKGVFCSSLI